MNVALPSIPQAVIVALPLFVAVFTGLLGHQALPAWTNSIIAGVFIIGGAVLSIALGQGFTSNVTMDFLLFAGYSAALVSSPVLKPLLDKLLIATPSPLAFLAKPQATTVATQGKTSNAATSVAWRPPPRPIELKPPKDTTGG